MRHLLLAILALLQPAAGAPVTDRQTHTLALDPGGTLSVEITVGQVRIEGGDGPEAVLDVVRHAPTVDGLERIPVLIEARNGGVRVRGVQPEGGTDPAYRTDLMLRVPRAATLDAIRVLEGRLTLSGLGGAVTADVRRGDIGATDLAGTIRLETGIGDIVAERIRLSAAGLIRLRAFNGDVRLVLAERPQDARVLALALNGTIASTIPLNRRDTWGPRWGEATLGRGEPVISIDVITGRIDIRAPDP